MPKMKKKRDVYDVEQFNSDDPQSQWPDGVIENPLSSTGYSYGSLQMVPAPIGGGMTTQDGFEIEDGQWIVKQNSVVFSVNNSDIQKYLEIEA